MLLQPRLSSLGPLSTPYRALVWRRFTERGHRHFFRIISANLFFFFPIRGAIFVIMWKKATGELSPYAIPAIRYNRKPIFRIFDTYPYPKTTVASTVYVCTRQRGFLFTMRVLRCRYAKKRTFTSSIIVCNCTALCCFFSPLPCQLEKKSQKGVCEKRFPGFFLRLLSYPKFKKKNAK